MTIGFWKSKQPLSIVLGIMIWLGLATNLWAIESPAGKLISFQGQVSLLLTGTSDWRDVRTGQDLFAGDTIRTGPDSRAAILCIDETQLKLNENTIVILKSGVPSPRLGGVIPAGARPVEGSFYEVPQGEIWLRNKNDKARFEVQTPAVTAAIRGTEFNLKVAPEGITSLVLLEGSLRFSNPFGELELNPGEEGLARPGQAPTKRVLLQPDDAVQWSLYYPGFFSFRDIPLGSGAGDVPDGSALLRDALESYDRGDLDRAQQGALEAIGASPQDPLALTLLGWIDLQKMAPEEARDAFDEALKSSDRRDARTIAGLALSRYQLGDTVGAYKLMREHRLKAPPTPLTLVMSGYFSLLSGKVEEARSLLSDCAGETAAGVMARSLLAQILLAQNRKDMAAEEAARALKDRPSSPLACMTTGLVRIAYFDLPKARELMEEATRLDPTFVDAYLYQARIWLGGEYLDKAWETIQKALALAPREAEVLSLAGFIRLGFRDFERAKKLFTQAAETNSALGEPHMGLSSCYFRDRDFQRGLSEMLAATLLEPRVSLYQCGLGKALYQSKAFAKALEVYDYAETLDPQDPTPHLYKGIALTDLNRPGEAIEEINRSIELNENRAVFRSRNMLDRDLAVRNSSLARSYNQLGLSDWVYSKAVSAVKNDPTDSAAHLFLGAALQSTRQRTGAAGSEYLLYRLLSPANQNTFIVYNDYTPMFEMPYMRTQIQGGVGTWDSKGPIQDHSLEIYGGVPGLALDVYAGYQDDPGFRKSNGDGNLVSTSFLGKAEPTVKDSFLASVSYADSTFGDNANLSDFGYSNDLYQRQNSNNMTVEGGYVHRFSPRSILIGHFGYSDQYSRLNNYYYYPDFIRIGSIPIDATFFDKRVATDEMYGFQLQQQYVYGDHTFMVGMDCFKGSFNYDLLQDLALSVYGEPIYSTQYRWQYAPPQQATVLYALDYWKITPKLLAEVGLFGEFTKNTRYSYADSISRSAVDPRLGLNYEINKTHTLRLAFQSYLNAHSTLISTITPGEVAGFPSQINADDGSSVKELGLAWEAQWNSKSFTSLRFNSHWVATPQFDPTTTGRILDIDADRYQVSFGYNRILLPCLGMRLGAAAKKVMTSADPVFNLTDGDFIEVDGLVGLSYLRPDGWTAGFNVWVIHQNLSDPALSQYQHDIAGDVFPLLDLSFGKEFSNKRGYFSFAVTNVFNQHFYYQKEFVTLNSIYPERRIMFRLAFNF